MAEKKIMDLVFATIVGIFFIGMFTSFFIGADNLISNNGSISTDLNNLSGQNNFQGDYNTLETNLEQQTYNLDTFSISETGSVDTRGFGQAISASKDSSSTNTNFIENASNLVKLNPLISSLIISALVLLGVALFLRFVRPGGA